MDVPTLCAACTEALMAGQNITLSLPKGERWPHRFPRGALFSVGTNGARNVSFDPLRVLAWVQQATKEMRAIHDGFTPTASTHVGVDLGA